MIKQDIWQGTPVYKMSNELLTVTLCPGINNNVISVYDHVLDREMLRVPASPEELKDNPIHYGTPILFPPNRIRQGRFSFNGREYQFNVNHPQGNHIHGLFRTQPWEVTGTKEEGGSASITCEIRTQDYEEVLRQYPHTLKLEVTYELKGSSLVQKLAVTNQGDTTAPIGYGLHTWFLLSGQPERWSLQLPVSGIWELDEQNIPTGQITGLGKYEGLGQGLNLRGQNMDTVFRIGDNPCLAVLSGPDCDIRYSGSDDFKHWVIYTKGEADQFICLEPYTWVTDAPNIDRDSSITGVIGLEQGASRQFEVTLDIVHK